MDLKLAGGLRQHAQDLALTVHGINDALFQRRFQWGERQVVLVVRRFSWYSLGFSIGVSISGLAAPVVRGRGTGRHGRRLGSCRSA